jgi:GMP synthase (glutamine-hydrolysing)
MVKEITAKELNIENFINDKVKEIQHMVGDGMAINALSGGVENRNRLWVFSKSLALRLK